MRANSGENPGGSRLIFRLEDWDGEVDKAVWSDAYVNDLPDSAFLLVETGGRKDDEGKTVPRSLRHFPVRPALARSALQASAPQVAPPLEPRASAQAPSKQPRAGRATRPDKAHRPRPCRCSLHRKLDTACLPHGRTGLGRQRSNRIERPFDCCFRGRPGRQVTPSSQGQRKERRRRMPSCGCAATIDAHTPTSEHVERTTCG